MMKQLNNYFYSILAICTCLITGPDMFGQGETIEKTYRWKQNVDPQESFTFNNYDCDLVIHTWDQPEIEYALTIHAIMKSEEDARRLDQYIDGLEFSLPSGSVKFDNRFWSQRVQNKFKKTMTLKGDKTIRYVDLNMKGELWIPRNCILRLASKYSEIEIEDLNGAVYLDLYNDKIFGSNVHNRINMTAKYSTLEFKQMKDIEADLYNTDFEAGDIGNLSIQSKYSDFKAGHAERVNISAYNDKYFFENTGDLKFTHKYSDLNVTHTGSVEMDCYNSTVHFTSAGDVDLRSKYGKYEIEEARTLHVDTAYNDQYKIDKLNALNIDESKYCVFKVDFLERSFVLKEGYSDKFLINGTGNFQGMEVNGKYVEVEMALDRNLPFRFTANVKYGNFDLNEEGMNVRKKIQNGPELEMEAVKGPESEGMPSFLVNGFEMSVKLNEQY